MPTYGSLPSDSHYFKGNPFQKMAEDLRYQENRPKKHPSRMTKPLIPNTPSPSPGLLNREFEHRLRSAIHQLNPTSSPHYAMSNSYLLSSNIAGQFKHLTIVIVFRVPQ